MIGREPGDRIAHSSYTPTSSELVTERKILIISYLFPPMGGIAVQRALSLAKYLPNYGFEVHVLRAANAAGPVYDPALLERVPDCVTVHKAFTPEIPFSVRQKLWAIAGAGGRKPKQQVRSRAASEKAAGKPSFLMRAAQHVLCPEPEVLWYRFALRKARQIIREHNIDCVLVTAPPFSAFLIGNMLKREFPAITYVADFRDEWLTFYINNNEFQNNPRTRKRAAVIERETVSAADVVVAVTESSLAEIQRRYPEQPASKFSCVPNGYDPDAFAGFSPRPHGTGSVVITHVGTVYQNSSPRYYFEALRRLPPEIRSRIKTRFIGRLAESELQWISPEDDVELLGFMPQASALRYMEETDYLLLTMTDPISIPGKFYEYLATGKPILAIAPRGSEVDLAISETKCGWCSAPNNLGDTKKMLATAAGREMPRFLIRKEGRSFRRPDLIASLGSIIQAAATPSTRYAR